MSETNIAANLSTSLDNIIKQNSKKPFFK